MIFIFYMYLNGRNNSMELLRGIQNLKNQNVTCQHAVVTIGNFDGVHLGHQKIIEMTLEKAKARGGTSIAYTFRPHPQIALKPDSSIQLLSTSDEKIELLGATGLDIMVEEPFS